MELKLLLRVTFLTGHATRPFFVFSLDTKSFESFHTFLSCFLLENEALKCLDTIFQSQFSFGRSSPGFGEHSWRFAPPTFPSQPPSIQLIPWRQQLPDPQKWSQGPDFSPHFSQHSLAAKKCKCTGRWGLPFTWIGNAVISELLPWASLWYTLFLKPAPQNFVLSPGHLLLQSDSGFLISRFSVLLHQHSPPFWFEKYL